MYAHHVTSESRDVRIYARVVHFNIAHCPQPALHTIQMSILTTLSNINQHAWPSRRFPTHLCYAIAPASCIMSCSSGSRAQQYHLGRQQPNPTPCAFSVAFENAKSSSVFLISAPRDTSPPAGRARARTLRACPFLALFPPRASHPTNCRKP